MKHKRFVGFTSLFLTSALFGSFAIWIRLLSSELSTYQQIVFRNIIAFVFATLFILLRKTDLKKLATVNKFKLAAFTLLVPLAVILYVIAILETKISVVTFAFYAGTISTSWLIGVLFFKEKINKIGLSSLLFVAVGLFFLTYPFSIRTLSFGFVIAIVSGIVDSFGHALRKDFTGKIDRLLLVLLTTIGGVILSGTMILVSNNDLNFFPQITNTGWIIGIIFGFSLVAVNFLLLLGFQNFDLSLGSIVLVAELFFATVFAMIVLKEFPTKLELVGGVFILIASILPNLEGLFKVKNILKVV